MAKKNFDDFLDTVEKPKRPTPEEAARMVALVHAQNQPAPPPTAPAEKAPEPLSKKIKAQKAITPKPQTAGRAKSKSAAPAELPPNPRGRPRTVRNETERLYRLSVDLPGSVLLKLKGAAMNAGTDMKTYVRSLLEGHL